MRQKGSRKTCQEGADGEGHDLIFCDVNAHTGGCMRIFTHRDESTADTAVDDVVLDDHHDDQQNHRDKEEVKDGNEIEKVIPEPEMIHTFQHWKSLGFKVKKGEHAVARIEIWKHASKTETDENGEEIDKSRMFRKVACFFSMSQVERMEATA